jgi:hypothetical protein
MIMETGAADGVVSVLTRADAPTSRPDAGAVNGRPASPRRENVNLKQEGSRAQSSSPGGRTHVM